MNQLAPIVPTCALPAIITAAGDAASRRFLEFFSATIDNANTRQAYARAVSVFLAWCEDHGAASITEVQALHVATWIEMQTRKFSPPTVKQRLAAIRHLFDWLVIGQVVLLNPAASVRGPAHTASTGKTPVLEPAEARVLIDAIDIMTPAGLRDRALISLMVYSFARIGAALGMKVEDVFTQNRRLWVRLREKGGKAHAMPCHHNLEAYLTAYIEQSGLLDDAKGPLFRTIGRGTGKLTRTALPRANAYAMVQRRTEAAGIATKIGNHSFRATGITAYLKNGGTLEMAAQMANHASTRTTQLYDRRHHEMSLDEVERIRVQSYRICNDALPALAAAEIVPEESMASVEFNRDKALRNLKLRICEYAVEDDSFIRILAEISRLIRLSEQACQKAESRGDRDEAYFEAICGEEGEVIEELIGVAFLVLQIKISRVKTAAAHILANHFDVDRLCGNFEPYQYSMIEFITELANYYKHREERLDGRGKKRQKVIKELGLHDASSGNLKLAFEKLGVAPHSDCVKLAAHVQEWAKQVLLAARANASGDAPN